MSNDPWDPETPLTYGQIEAAANWFGDAIRLAPLPAWRRTFRFLDNREDTAKRIEGEIRSALYGRASKTTLFYFAGVLSVHRRHRYDTAYLDIKFPPGVFRYSASALFSNDGRFHAQSR